MKGVGKPACVDCFRPDVTARPKESEKVSIMTSNRIGRYLTRKRNLGFLFLYVLQKSLCGPKVRPAQALTTVFGKGFFCFGLTMRFGVTFSQSFFISLRVVYINRRREGTYFGFFFLFSASTEDSAAIMSGTGHARQQIRFLSSSVSKVGPRQQQPNRFTTFYQSMKETCPAQIQLYAKCVSSANEAGTLSKGSCEHEFALVKDCFRSAKRQ